jgi:hypothetical protein
MDPFTTDPLRIGLPTGDRAARFQQYVSNLTVATSATVSGVTAGSFGDGNIEFWPNNYGQANGAGIPGASASAYDFGDTVAADIMFGHGSMQVHNYRLGQTIFAVNHFGKDSYAPEMGIGNSPSGAPDWTSAGNQNSYASRTLYVLIRPSVAPPAEPAPVPGWGTLPAVVISPVDQLVEVGAPAVFSVFAKGAERYQWRKDGVFIPGATSSFLEIPDTRNRNLGDYDVLVYGTGSRYAVSGSARLSVNSKGIVLLIK